MRMLSSFKVKWPHGQALSGSVTDSASATFIASPTYVSATLSCPLVQKLRQVTLCLQAATGPLRNTRFWRGPEVEGRPEVAEA